LLVIDDTTYDEFCLEKHQNQWMAAIRINKKLNANHRVFLSPCLEILSIIALSATRYYFFREEDNCRKFRSKVLIGYT
jgi:hypothetical protein